MHQPPQDLSRTEATPRTISTAQQADGPKPPNIMMLIRLFQTADQAKKPLLRPLAHTDFNIIKELEQLASMHIRHVEQVKFGKAISTASSARFEAAQSKAPLFQGDGRNSEAATGQVGPSKACEARPVSGGRVRMTLPNVDQNFSNSSCISRAEESTTVCTNSAPSCKAAQPGMLQTSPSIEQTCTAHPSSCHWLQPRVSICWSRCTLPVGGSTARML